MSEIDEILLDAHVHLHPCFAPARFFDAALANFRTVATRTGPDTKITGCLMFTESHGVNAFGHLQAHAAGAGTDSEGRPTNLDSWDISATGEEISLFATRMTANHVDRILLVAGRQLVTRERLEVLALGCAAELEDGMKLEHAIDATVTAGAVPVIPWGFGKWWGRRGAVLTDLLGSTEEPRFFLGDNSGRAALFPRPPLFGEAAVRGVFVLPGSDPLPFASQASRPGRCGLRLPVELDENRPGSSVLAALRALDDQPDVFGRYESLLGFVRSQVAMQWRKGPA